MCVSAENRRIIGVQPPDLAIFAALEAKMGCCRSFRSVRPIIGSQKTPRPSMRRAILSGRSVWKAIGIRARRAVYGTCEATRIVSPVGGRATSGTPRASGSASPGSRRRPSAARQGRHNPTTRRDRRGRLGHPRQRSVTEHRAPMVPDPTLSADEARARAAVPGYCCYAIALHGRWRTKSGVFCPTRRKGIFQKSCEKRLFRLSDSSGVTVVAKELCLVPQ